MGKTTSRSILTIVAVFLAITAVAGQGEEVVLEGIKPTLTGFSNTAFVKSAEVGPDKIKMTEFARDQDSAGPLVVAKSGKIWGTEVPFAIGATEWKLDGDAHVAIDPDEGFVGNLDYDGSIYTFIGTVRLMKHVFTSDEKNPLVFKLVKDKGLVHLKGKGTVELPDGKSISIPPTAR